MDETEERIRLTEIAKDFTLQYLGEKDANLGEEGKTGDAARERFQRAFTFVHKTLAETHHKQPRAAAPPQQALQTVPAPRYQSAEPPPVQQQPAASPLRSPVAQPVAQQATQLHQEAALDIRKPQKNYVDENRVPTENLPLTQDKAKVLSEDSWRAARERQLAFLKNRNKT